MNSTTRKWINDEKKWPVKNKKLRPKQWFQIRTLEISSLSAKKLRHKQNGLKEKEKESKREGVNTFNPEGRREIEHKGSPN